MIYIPVANFGTHPLVQQHWELELVTEIQLGEVEMKPSIVILMYKPCNSTVLTLKSNSMIEIS